MGLKFSSSTAEKFSLLYSPDKLFSKIGKVAQIASANVIYQALLLYYALVDKNVPFKDKVIVVGALGYFICPLDAIPDALVPLGYTDDAAALTFAIKTIASNISDETRVKARNRLEQWFDDINPKDLKIF